MWGKYSENLARDNGGRAIYLARQHHLEAPERYDGYRDLSKPAHNLFDIKVKHEQFGVAHVTVGLSEASMYLDSMNLIRKVESPEHHKL